MMKRILALLLSVMMIFSLCACDFMKDLSDFVENDTPTSKTFDLDGISIELTTDFIRMDFLDEEYDFVIGTESVSVFGFDMTFDDTGLDKASVLEFADVFRQQMMNTYPDITEIVDEGGIQMFQYADSEDGEALTSVVAFYKASDRFWIITFAIETKDYEKLYPEICKYAKSVKCE